MLQVKITPQKDKRRQLSGKYISSHCKKVNKIQVPRKQEDKFIVPPIPIKHKKIYGIEDCAIKNGELQLRNKVPEVQRIVQQQRQGKFAPKKCQCLIIY